MPDFEYIPKEYTGPPPKELHRLRKERLSPALFSVYDSPLVIHDGKQQFLFDHTGRRYLDLYGGIVTVSLGHCHPAINEAAKEQMESLWHTSNIYYNPSIHQYAEALTDTMPGNLKVVYFVNSGSEANDLALLMSRIHTGRFDAVTLRNSYHGASPYTAGLTGKSNSKYMIANGFGIHHVMNADPYRGMWGGHRDSPIQSCRACESQLLEGGHVCSSSHKYVNQLEELLDTCVHQGKPAAFFNESIQGVGAVIQFPLGFVKKAYELVRDRGGLCISDEVQTGFGRTGDNFWAFQDHGVIPDIVTMAKGIGNGYPLAAVVTTPEIASSLSRAFHFNTFGGNAIGSAIGLSVLKTMQKENTMQHSKDVGTYFLKQLEPLCEEFDTIGDLRGKGLMIGLEMVESQSDHKYMAPERFNQIWESCREMGVLLGKGGPKGTVFRITPPMCITKEDVDFSVQVFREALKIDQTKHSQ